jgi:hypothetical protein
MSELVSESKDKTKILFVFEGINPESQIFQNLSQTFFVDSCFNHIKAIFGQDIYELYRLLKKEDGFRDLLDIIKEKSPDKEALDGVLRKHISDIYLVFDYDGHATKASDDDLKEMLSYFKEAEVEDEEFDRDNVRLYISYPMSEAIKHLKLGINFQEVIVDAKENINYKNFVSLNCDNIFNQIKKWELNHWAVIIHEHCSKLNFVTTDNYVFPNRTFEQLEVFEAQLEKYINPTNTVAVLSAFPVLLLDYYGAKGLHNKISSYLTTQQESI